MQLIFHLVYLYHLEGSEKIFFKKVVLKFAMEKCFKLSAEKLILKTALSLEYREVFA